MSSIGNTGKKIADWLSVGTTMQVWIKKALVVLVRRATVPSSRSLIPVRV